MIQARLDFHLLVILPCRPVLPFALFFMMAFTFGAFFLRLVEKFRQNVARQDYSVNLSILRSFRPISARRPTCYSLNYPIKKFILLE